MVSSTLLLRAGLPACLLTLLAMAGCVTTQLPTIPPVTKSATGIMAPGRVVSHELATLDLDKAKAFYGAVFGWTFIDLPGNPRSYTVALHDGEPIGGMFPFVSGDPGTHASEWIPVFSSPDVDAAVGTARSSGATILAEPRDIPDRGRLALLVDPQKAVFFLLRTKYGDPPARVAPVNSWLWDELWTRDPKAAIDFYGRLFPLSFEEKSQSKNDYYVLSVEGEPRAGVMQLRAEGLRPHWVPIIRVEDAAATAAKAQSAGGEILIEPEETSRGGRAALLLDATGAPLAIQEYNP